MTGHGLWHVAVLGSALFGAAGAAIIILAPLVFDAPPPGLARWRPLIAALVAVPALLVVVEWTLVH